MIDRIGLRIGAPRLLLIAIAGGSLLWLSSFTGQAPANGSFHSVVRGASWAYSAFLFAFVLGWCTGDIYLRFHGSGRWLLSEVRQKGAEVAATGFAIGGALLVTAALTQSRDLAFVGVGIVGGGLSISRSLAVFLRLASPSEFALSLAMASSMMVALAAAAGVWDRTFMVTVAACGLLAWTFRLAGWPHVESSR